MNTKTYAQIQQHLRDTRKSLEHFKKFSCSVCGLRATGWDLPEGKGETDPQGRRFSQDPRDYQPRCKFHLPPVDAEKAQRAEAERRDQRREVGREVGKAVMRMRRKCLDCPMTSTPLGIGRHLKASGHSGWEEVSA